MERIVDEIVRRRHEAEIERMRHDPPPPPPEPRTIHYTELKPLPAGAPLATEWNFYLRAIERLLAEGHEGRWVLINGETIVGVWDTASEAAQRRGELFPLQPALNQCVLEREEVHPSTWLIRGLPSEIASSVRPANDPKGSAPRIMAMNVDDIVRRLHREEVERLRNEPPPPSPERPTLHYWELKPLPVEERLATEPL